MNIYQDNLKVKYVENRPDFVVPIFELVGENVSFIGSGFLLNSGQLVTANHVVTSKGDPTKLSGKLFTLTNDGNQHFLNTCKHYDLADIAILNLPVAIATKSNVRLRPNFRKSSWNELSKKNLEFAGFRLVNHKIGIDGKEWTAGPCIPKSPDFTDRNLLSGLTIDNTSFEGQSGSPVFFVSNGIYFVVGVLCQGGGSPHSKVTLFESQRVDDDVLKDYEYGVVDEFTPAAKSDYEAVRAVHRELWAFSESLPLPPPRIRIRVRGLSKEKNNSLFADSVHELLGFGSLALLHGDAGTGKSHLLQEHVRFLLKQSHKEFSTPVLLRASTWRRGDSTPKWIERVLSDFYGIHPQQAKSFVNHEDLVLLVDGLDELESAGGCLASFVSALNEYRLVSQVSLVVTCRTSTAEFVANAMPDDLVSCEVTCPKTNDVLECIKKSRMHGLESVIHALSSLDWPGEIPPTPLHVKMLIEVFRGLPEEKVFEVLNCKDPLEALYDKWMLVSFSKTTLNWPKHQIRKTIELFASHCNDETVSIDNLQPELLSSTTGEDDVMRKYANTTSLVLAFLLALFTAIPLGGASYLDAKALELNCPTLHGFWSLIGGLFIGLIVGFFAYRLRGWKSGIALALWLGMLRGWAVFFEPTHTSISFSAGDAVWRGMFLFAAVAIPCALHRRNHNIFEIHPPARISFDIRGLGLGLAIGTAGLVVLTLVENLGVALVFGVSITLTISGWLGFCRAGVPIGKLSAGSRIRIALISALAFGIFIPLINSIGLFLATRTSVTDGWGSAIGGLVCLGFFLSFGGITVVQHFVLRMFLNSRFQVPWKLNSLMTFCADNGLLKKCGPVFQFPHPTIRKSIASRPKD